MSCRLLLHWKYGRQIKRGLLLHVSQHFVYLFPSPECPYFVLLITQRGLLGVYLDSTIFVIQYIQREP